MMPETLPLFTQAEIDALRVPATAPDPEGTQPAQPGRNHQDPRTERTPPGMTSTPAASIDADTAFDALITATLTYSIREANPGGCTDAALEAARDQVTSAARTLAAAGNDQDLFPLIRTAIYDPGRYVKRGSNSGDREALSEWQARAVLVVLTRTGLLTPEGGATAATTRTPAPRGHHPA